MDKKAIIANMVLRDKADLLTGGAFYKTRALPNHGIRDMYLSDGPHGLRKQSEAEDHLGLHPSIPSTCFPTSSIMACSWDEALGEKVGKALGKEAASIGVDMLLGPGLNIKRSPLCGRNFEYFSEDPFLTGKMAAAYVRGTQSENVNACVKHFAANNREYRRMTSNSIVDERTLREIYLTGFEIAIKEGNVNAVMSSYNQLNGVYTNENFHLLHEILREEWGYTGVVVTDWAGCNSRVEGLKCGNDLEMPFCKYGADDIYKAALAKEIEESLIDESIERILELIEFSDKKRTYNEEERAALLEENHTLAREAAAKSIVLLENDGVLPLAKERKVALIGDFAFSPRYQGAGSSIVNPSKDPEKGLTVEYALEGLSANVIARAQGFDRYGRQDEALFQEALTVAEEAEIVLFFAGLDELSEAEGVDREHIRIPKNQAELCRALIAAGKKVVVVLSCGSVVQTDWAEGASALLYVGLSGQAGALAVADVLYGNVNPSGKLAESWVNDYEDEPTSDPSYFPGGIDCVEYREGLFVGYRYFTTAAVKPKYPFGYGKSYTSFEYSNLKASRNGAEVTVTNTGAFYGDEIVQFYISLPKSRLVRPARELKGFARISLNPGESKRVAVTFSERTFAYYDVATKSWQVEGGEYNVSAAASSEDIRLTARVEIAGTVPAYELQKYPTYASGNVKNVPDDEFYALLGYEPEPEEMGKKRRRVHENTTVEDLKYAKGWAGRLFSWAVCKLAVGYYKLRGNAAKVNEMRMATHQPMRGLAKFLHFSRRTMEGLITIFNGRFFKGLGMLLRKKKGAVTRNE
ncbi:MAG: glycoside hydrolase family 3 C-terminal domain-containing protein [Clostridia bacterium]|nr:glycoside hydrolase family 3 C-terminal domain-containing protein [Clostridia bacterium]